MASTKFTFESIGVEKVINNFKSLSDAHTRFINLYIQGEQKLSQFITQQTNDRVRVMSDMYTRLGQLEKTYNGLNLQSVRAHLDSIVSAEQDATQKIESEHKKRLISASNRGGGGPTSSGAASSLGIPVTSLGIAGLGVGFAKSIVDMQLELARQTIDLVRSKIQTELARSDLAAAIIANQPGTAGKTPGTMGVGELKFAAEKSSTITGVSVENILKAGLDIAKYGGTVSKQNMQFVAEYMALDPSLDPSKIAKGFASTNKILGDDTKTKKVLDAIFYSSHKAGIPVEDLINPVTQLSARELSYGMKGSAEHQLVTTARIAELLSLGGMTMGNVRSGTTSVLSGVSKNENIFGKLSQYKDLQEVLNAITSKIDPKQSLDLQLQKLGIHDKTGKALVSTYLGLSKSQNKTKEMEELLKGVDLEESAKDFSIRMKEVLQDPWIKFKNVMNEFYNVLGDALLPAAEGVITYIRNNKDKIKTVLETIGVFAKTLIPLYAPVSVH